MVSRNSWVFMRAEGLMKRVGWAVPWISNDFLSNDMDQVISIHKHRTQIQRFRDVYESNTPELLSQDSVSCYKTGRLAFFEATAKRTLKVYTTTSLINHQCKIWGIPLRSIMQPPSISKTTALP
jgi:hypothetical protein